MSTSNTVNQVKQEGKQAARKVANQPWVSPFIRLGFAARGIIYGLMGILAIQVALGGSSGRFTSQQGAIATIGQQPGGKILLIIVAVGLFGYALWGLIRAILDPLGKGSDAGGILSRIGSAISAVSYGALFGYTMQFITRRASSSGGSGTKTATALLSKSYGPWLVGAIALGLIGAAVSQIIQGYKADFDMRFDPYALSPQQRLWATRLGRFGYIARGIVFAIVGFFMFQAALFHDPSKVRGFDGALAELTKQPYGIPLLAIVAAGLIAFGAYNLLGAAWFKLKKS